MSETREAPHAQKERDRHDTVNDSDMPCESDKRGESDDRQSDTQRDGNGGDDKKGDQKPKSRWPMIIAAVLILGGAVGGGVYWFLTRNLESTDDAYTEGDAISIASKVPGYVVGKSVDDNSVVHAGDLLIKIDPRDYIAARDQAQANLDSAQAQLSSAQNDLEIARIRAPANLSQAKAQLAQAQANQTQARRDYNRQRAVDPRATTQTNVDQATAALASSAANVEAAQAQVSVASLVQQNIQAAEDSVSLRHAQVEQARASLTQAETNLSYTEIRAPQDGRITKRNVDLGTFVQSGQQMFYIVTTRVWIIANFKETQLDRMRVSQKVDIDVDGYPGLSLSGHIDSIQSGSGARFSAFPAENATGNFVKIVRRVPVKILIDHGLEKWPDMPLGLSVVPTVHLQ